MTDNHLDAEELISETLRFMAQLGWKETRQEFFTALVTFLGQKLGVEYALVDELLPDKITARTIGVYAAGKIIPDIEYSLKGTPCENVIGKNLCSYPRGIQNLFPEDKLLVDMGAESYVGIPLWSTKGEGIGLIAVMGQSVLTNLKAVETVLQLVATRCAHELEQIRNEEALRKSEAQFRSFFEKHSAVKLVIDSNSGAIEKANQAAVEFYGWSCETMKTMNIQEINILPPEEICKKMKSAHSHVETQFEFQHRLADGSIKWVEVHTSQICFLDKDCLFSIIHDITDHKLALRALQESEAKFRSIINASPVPYAINDVQLNVTYLNPAFIQTFGYTTDDIPTLGKWWTEAYPDPAYRHYVTSTWDENLEKAQQSDNDFDPIEIDICCKDGSTKTVIAHAAPIGDDFSGDHLVVLQDITERKTKEDQIINLTRVKNLILETAPLGISKIVDRKEVWVNHKTTEMFGYSKEELEGKTTRILYPSQEAYDLLGAEAYPVLAEGKTFETVRELVRKDGVHIQVRYVGKAVTPDDMTKGTIWLSEDITEKKQMEENLIRAKVDAESANRAKSEFLANMSHEIRTPMNGILGMSQLLAYTELNDEQKKYLTAINTSGNNLLILINDILDLSKVEAEKLDINLENFSLRRCINELLATQKSQIENKGLSHSIDVSADVPDALVGDQLRIKQVLLNLLGNAIKFTETGAITITVSEVEQRESGVLLDIAVHDTGIGIPLDIQGNIFEPFTQADSSTTRRFGGTGLGLTICQRLAALMKGSLRVESQEGVGSTFYLRLPFTVACLPTNEEEQRPQILWDGPDQKILLAEDNAINIKYMKTLLEKMGHQVTVAENGRLALDALKTNSFDLVLMDIQMPEMTGDTALQIIREQKSGHKKHLKVIALTAYAFKDDKEKYIQMGFDGYLAKPIDIKAIAQEMRRVTEKSA